MSLYRHPSGVYRSSLLDQISWADHGFGTGRTNPIATSRQLQQIHSPNVINVLDWHNGCPGDALISNDPGAWISVKTADCVPILLADLEHRAVAAIHAGWRGTKDRIAHATLDKMRKDYGTRGESVVAAIGPSIGVCCFEVGPEVAEEFRDLFPERNDLDQKTRIDLAEANRRLLTQAGIPDGAISAQAPCTFCGREEFHSWRRDHQTGQRMISAIAVRDLS